MVKFYKVDADSTLEDYQNACFNVFKHLIKFLDENKIEYWLDGGSILGLIRHGDFIPWDDDIDIAMDAKNYQKFRELALNGLPDELSFIDENNSYMKKGFCKVLHHNYEMVNHVKENEYAIYGAYVDIFLMVNYPILPLKFKKPILNIFGRLFGNLEAASYKISMKNIIKMSIYMVFGIAIRLIWRLLPKSKKIANPLGLNVYNILHEEASIYPLRKLKWRDVEVNVPNNSDAYIRELYGNNYMQIPPLEKQITHASKILINA